MSVVPSLVSGKAWFGKIAAKQSNVLYLDWENPVDYVAGNLKAQMPIEDWGEHRSRLFVPDTLPSYLTVDWLNAWRENHQIQGATVVVIDSAYAAFGQQFAHLNVTWEHAGSHVRSILDPLIKWCRETGFAVVLIHHHNKSGDTTGSAQWEGGVDYVWSYQKAGDNRRLSAKHGRWLGNKPNSLVFSYTDKLQLVGTTLDVYQSEMTHSVVDLLSHIPKIELGQGFMPTEENTVSQKDLQTALGLSSGKVSETLTELVEDQRIVCVQVKGKGRPTNRYYQCLSLTG